MAFASEAYVAKEAGGPITMETIQYGTIGKNELIVDIVAFSMCASDLKAAKGDFHLEPPIILGHESPGIGSHSRQSGPRTIIMAYGY